MIVLHIITGLNVGGAETMLARLMENTASTADIHSEIITLIDPGPVGDGIAAMGVPVHSLGMRGGLPSPSAAFRIAALVRRIRPDLIMGWMHHGHLAATLAAGRTPMLWNVRHSLGGYRDEKSMTRMVLRLGAWLSRRPDAIVYNSRAATQQYRALGYRPRREIVIPNGFDRTAYRSRDEARPLLCAIFGIPLDRIIIGLVARNHPMKDVPNLAMAFAEVLAAGHDVHLLIVGSDMDRPSEAAAKQLATLPPERWTLAGYRTDVADWLAGLDIAALPSAWGEGFPNFIGEAMGCQVPCVGTDVGDTAWVIGSTGRTVPSRHAPLFAAGLLELVIMGPSGRAALGQAARARVEEYFTLASVAQRYAALFREYGSPVSPATRGVRRWMAGEAL